MAIRQYAGGLNPLATSRPRRRPVVIPVQAKTEEQDIAGVTRYACSLCQITYYGDGGKPKCPLCDAQLRMDQLQDTMTGMRNQIKLLEDTVTKLKVGAEIITAMRHALDAISIEDLAFLKSILYRYRQDHTYLSLRATHGAGGSKKTPPPANGFIAVFKTVGQEPEAHLCNSMGGVAIAGYYEEVVRSTGAPMALSMLMQAISQVLAPGREE